MTNAYDHKNRRIFKSFYNEDTTKEAQGFRVKVQGQVARRYRQSI